jgi:hypothetical protein
MSKVFKVFWRYFKEFRRYFNILKFKIYFNDIYTILQRILKDIIVFSIYFEVFEEKLIYFEDITKHMEVYFEDITKHMEVVSMYVIGQYVYNPKLNKMDNSHAHHNY